MRFLSSSEKQRLAQVSEQIVDGGNQSPNSKAIFYPKMVEDNGAIDPMTWASMPKSSKKAFIFLSICADIYCVGGGRERLAGKKPAAVSGLGRAIWTSSLANSNKNFSQQYGWSVANTYSGVTDPELSKDLYKFQHYAEFSELGESNPTVADPLKNMPDAISGGSGGKSYNRDGILGNRTMGQLTAMVNSNFTKVSANAVDIATAGAALARKLTDALSWTELDAAKANPSFAAVPARSQAIDCSGIDFSMLKAGIEGGNPAYDGCKDYYNSIMSQQGGGGGGQSNSNTPPPKPQADLDYLRRQATQWYQAQQLDKMKVPGIPGVDYSKAVALLQKRKASQSDLPPADSSSEKPLPPEVESEDTEAIAFDETPPAQTESASTDIVRTSTFFRDENGNIKPWIIGAGILGAAGLAWLLLSSGGDEIEYNEFGQPLQPYDENGMPIIQTNKYGQPLQGYDLQGRPVALTNRFGSPLQTYDENGKVVGRQNSDGTPMVLFDLENNIVYVNQVANVSANAVANLSANASKTNPYGLYKRMY